jgi:hypothetical protein
LDIRLFSGDRDRTTESRFAGEGNPKMELQENRPQTSVFLQMKNPKTDGFTKHISLF